MRRLRAGEPCVIAAAWRGAGQRPRQRGREQDGTHRLLRAAAVGQRVLLRHHAAGLLVDAARPRCPHRVGAGRGAGVPDLPVGGPAGVRARVRPLRPAARDPGGPRSLSRRRRHCLAGAGHRRGARGTRGPGLRQRLRHRRGPCGAARHLARAGAGTGDGHGHGDLRAGAHLGAADRLRARGARRLAGDLPRHGRLCHVPARPRRGSVPGDQRGAGPFCPAAQAPHAIARPHRAQSPVALLP